MSSNTRPSELTVGAHFSLLSAKHAALLRVVLAIAYPLLAHLASHRRDGVLSACAIADIVLIVLLRPLLERRGWAWALLTGLGVGLFRLAHSGYALLPLLVVPVAFLGFVSYGFGRTLRQGRVPLITRMVAGLDELPASELAPGLRSYTRTLTASWAVLLGVLALLNLTLALLAVPNGLLAGMGLIPPITVSSMQWSWFANILNYGIVGGFFLLEFAFRQHHFPGRDHSLLDFLRRMARLGPAFWRDVTR